MANYWEYQNNKEFYHKIKWEMQAAAIAVMAELAETPGHTERIAYAQKILDGTASVKEFAIGVLTNADVEAAISNAAIGNPYGVDLTYVVNSMFNAFAGVSN